MSKRDPNKLKIRNRRRSHWGELIAGMLVALVFLAEGGLFVVSRQYHKVCLIVMFGSAIAMVPIMLYGFLQIWDLQRPIPKKPVSARVLFDWIVLGIRHKELGPSDGWTALTLFRPMLSKRYTICHLTLGDEIEIDNPMIHYPAPTVKQIRFAPDPNEDYIGAEAPIFYCHATVEMDSGREFCLVVTEADAQKIREWAATKNVNICNCDGYCPRPLLLANKAS